MALIWILLGIAMLFAELLFTDLTALMLALGAFAAAGLAFVGLPQAFQILGFTLAAAGLVLFLRPGLRNRIQPPESYHSGDGVFLGQEAEVFEAIEPERDGRIKIHGEIWNASSLDTIAPGEHVIITRLHNNIAEVVPTRALKAQSLLRIRAREGESS